MKSRESVQNSINNRNEKILILAPTGRDAELTAGFLEEAGFMAEICKSVAELCPKIKGNPGLIFLTGEVLNPETIQQLIASLKCQPPWSDIPLIVLTSGGSESPVNVEALSQLGEAANVTLIERPVRVMTLISAIKSALRARRRQYDIRDHIEEENRIASELERLFNLERASRAEAEAANRLKDDFLANVSHELRTPLNAMLGWTSLLRSDNLDAAATAHALEVIERNARSQAQIIEDLLDVSRIITGKLTLDVRKFEVSSLADSVIESVQPAAQAKEITIERNYSTDVNSITGDPTRLQQVLWNLLSNSIKFTGRGGKVSISINSRAADLIISVSDTGKGIAREFLPFVFDRFRQADGTTTRSFGGLGLGLSIVQHLVELHGGTVRADSDGEGKGATFTITLPLVAAPKHIVQAAANGSVRKNTSVSKPAGSLDGLAVLVVDDEVDSLEVLKLFLEKSGATVTAVNSVAEALENLQATAPDVIVSDIGMPGMDGYQFIENVRQMAPEKGGHTPAVALTAYARGEDVKKALRSGYQTHLAKPVELEKLVNTIASVAARR